MFVGPRCPGRLLETRTKLCKCEANGASMARLKQLTGTPVIVECVDWARQLRIVNSVVELWIMNYPLAVDVRLDAIAHHFLVPLKQLQMWLPIYLQRQHPTPSTTPSATENASFVVVQHCGLVW